MSRRCPLGNNKDMKSTDNEIFRSSNKRKKTNERENKGYMKGYMNLSESDMRDEQSNFL